MKLKPWKIFATADVIQRYEILFAIVALTTAILPSSCAISQTQEIPPNSAANSTPLSNSNTQISIDPSDRAFLLDWCDDFASSNGLGSLRKKKFRSNEAAIRVCIGVNTPRDTILLIEKKEDNVRATLVSTEVSAKKNAGSLLFKTSPLNLAETGDPDIWRWIEDSGLLNLESSKADCLSDPAYDSVVIVLEVRQGDSYFSQVASEGCCSIKSERGSVPRLVEELGTRLDVMLFKCVTK